jgi:ppGpp synthetase/RelA/SpoT-type nucleotidyltranferase
MDEPREVPAHLWSFAMQQDRMRSAADQLRVWLRGVLEAAGIDVYTVDTRAKSLASYQDKSERERKPGEARYTDPAAEITDCIAARIIVFTPDARTRAVTLLKKVASTRDWANPGEISRNGYDSDHCVIADIPDGAFGAASDLRWFLETRPGLEVQIRSVAGHAWAEYEHDVRYKPSGYVDLPPAQRKQIDQLFVEAGGLRRYLDQTFDRIDRVLRPDPTADAMPADSDEPPVTHETSAMTEDDLTPPDDAQADSPLDTSSLAAYLTERYPDAAVGTDADRDATLEQLGRLGLTSVGELRETLADVDSDQVSALMGYETRPTASRLLQDDLLAGLGEKFITRATNDDDNLRLLLEGRLRRVRGKTLIYTITGDPRLENHFFTAARTFRELVRLVARHHSPTAALLPGAVADADTLDPSARGKALRVDGGSLWVNTNMTRDAAERCIKQLLERLPGAQITVFRAGDEIGASPALE